MRYWIVTELFYPEEVSTGYVMTKIAEELNKEAEVGVICGPSGYQSGVFKANYLLAPDIIIKRVNIPRLNKNNLGIRLIGFAFLTIGIAFKILFNVKKSDKVILVTNPPTLLPVVAFLKFIKRFEFTIIVHDVFPENAAAGGILQKGFVYKILLAVFSRSYRAADKLIVVGTDMEKVFKAKVADKIPITVVTNWADHKDITPVTVNEFPEYYPQNIGKRIIIQFAGNIGRVQGMELFFEILCRTDNKNFLLVIIGDGAQKKMLEDIKTVHELYNIDFIPSKPRSEQKIFLNSCDIGLVTLCPGMYGLGVPSKVYNIFSAGKPVLYIGDRDSEISIYIQRYNVGWAFTWDEQKDIRDFMENLGEGMREDIKIKGANARKFVEDHLTQDILLRKYRSEIINKLP